MCSILTCINVFKNNCNDCNNRNKYFGIHNHFVFVIVKLIQISTLSTKRYLKIKFKQIMNKWYITIYSNIKTYFVDKIECKNLMKID